MTVKTIDIQFGAGVESAPKIVYEDLIIYEICAKFVPRNSMTNIKKDISVTQGRWLGSLLPIQEYLSV